MMNDYGNMLGRTVVVWSVVPPLPTLELFYALKKKVRSVLRTMNYYTIYHTPKTPIIFQP